MTTTAVAPTEIGVGIDVARYRHVVQFVGPDKKPLRKRLIVPESRTGYDRLAQALQRLHQQFPHALFRCVLDDANVYGRNLKAFLEQLPLRLVVSCVNPLTNRRYKQVFLQDHKNDAVDAYAVARFAVTEKPQPAPPSDPVIGLLKVLVSRLQSQTHHTTRLVNQLHQVLSLAFPEFVGLFQDFTTRTARGLLHKLPTAAAAAKAQPGRLAAFKPGRGCKPLGRERAQQLIQAARRSVATLSGPHAENLVRDLVHQLDLSLQSQDQLRAAIEQLYQEHRPNHLLSIPGVGPFAAAVLTAAIGDIQRFDSPEKLVGYFGVYPVDDESGRRQGRKGMSQKGNDLVRQALFMSSLVGARFNPVLRTHYARKRSQGKDKLVALGHVMRKLLHLVYAILRKNEPFDPNYAARSRGPASTRNEPSAPQAGQGPEGERSSEGSAVECTGEPAQEQLASSPADLAEPSAAESESDERQDLSAPTPLRPPRQTERTDTQSCPSNT